MGKRDITSLFNLNPEKFNIASASLNQDIQHRSEIRIFTNLEGFNIQEKIDVVRCGMRARNSEYTEYYSMPPSPPLLEVIRDAQVQSGQLSLGNLKVQVIENELAKRLKHIFKSGTKFQNESQKDWSIGSALTFKEKINNLQEFVMLLQENHPDCRLQEDVFLKLAQLPEKLKSYNSALNECHVAQEELNRLQQRQECLSSHISSANASEDAHELINLPSHIADANTKLGTSYEAIRALNLELHQLRDAIVQMFASPSAPTTTPKLS